MSNALFSSPPISLVRSLRSAVESETVQHLLSCCAPGAAIRVEEEAGGGSSGLAFFDRLVCDRGSWAGGSFTLDDYSRYLDGTGMAAAGSEFGRARGATVAGAGRGKVVDTRKFDYNRMPAAGDGLGATGGGAGFGGGVGAPPTSLSWG